MLRAAENGADQQQPINRVFVTPVTLSNVKPTDGTTQKITRDVPKAPSSNASPTATPSNVYSESNAAKKYEVGWVVEEQAKQRQLKWVLNELTPQNFEKLFEQVKQVNIDNVITLSGVVSQIFDEALMEPTKCELFVNLCIHLAAGLPELSVDDKKITFKRLLLNKCQEEFERGEGEEQEANKAEEEGEAKQTAEEREEKRLRIRRRMLGNIRLIGELYKKRMLTERIMHECINKLLGQYQNPDEENIEALCKLMSTVGEMIDHPKAKEFMDAYFDIMAQLSNNMKLSSSLRCMLKDAIDLRKNKWQQRRKVEGPKKIEEVHGDAAQELHAQSSRLHRAPSMGNSSRRTHMDFSPRSSSVLPSLSLHEEISAVKHAEQEPTPVLIPSLTDDALRPENEDIDNDDDELVHPSSSCTKDKALSDANVAKSAVPRGKKKKKDLSRKAKAPGPSSDLHRTHKVMHKAAKNEVGWVVEEQAKQRQLKWVLNELTPRNFEKLFEQVKQVNIDNVITLSGVVSQIFDEALMEPTKCELFVNLCIHLAAGLPELSVDDEKITFKRLLLNKCQEEFERGERVEQEANKAEEVGEAKQTAEEREEKRLRIRRRMLGNIRLIGELYKKRMLTERIMHECINKLLGQYQNPDEENIEALCKLMSTVGEMIDHPKAKDHMDAYFDIMTQLSNNMKLSSSLRCMLKDAIDLRKNKWQQRGKAEGPKKIEELHGDAAQELHAQSSRLHRAPSMGNSSRRTPMDFPPRSPKEETNPYRISNKQNMRMALYWLVQGCQPGHALVFHCSGHGSRQRN